MASKVFDYYDFQRPGFTMLETDLFPALAKQGRDFLVFERMAYGLIAEV